MEIYPFTSKTWNSIRTAFFIFLTTFLLGEIALRVYNHYFPSFIFHSESYNRFRGKPYSQRWGFRLNSKGYNDEEFNLEKSKNYRILGLGDSFAFGSVPYNFHYLTLVEKQLTAKNCNVELYNMGISGIGPPQYWRLLKEEGMSYKPDMVLLSFFVGNDFSEAIAKKRTDYSYIYSLMRYIYLLHSEIEDTKLGSTQSDYCDDCPSHSEAKFIRLERFRSFIFADEERIVPKFLEPFPKLLERSIFYMRQIKELCDKENIVLVVVLIPDEIQINKELFQQVGATFSLGQIKEDKWDLSLPNRQFVNELDKLNINSIDLYHHFLWDSSRILYRPRNTHWNMAGNQLAADVIENRLQIILEENAN